MGIEAGKAGIRTLGISESFIKGKSKKSVLAGVVMRGDMTIDGFSFGHATVGGMDSTASMIELYCRLKREDVNLLMLNGCIISWFNIVDLHQLCEETGRPVICVTYEESEGIDRYIKEYFGDWETRIAVCRKNGDRTKVALHTGQQIFVRFVGIEEDTGRRVLDRFTREGGVPEPLRISKILARTALRSGLTPYP